MKWKFRKKFYVLVEKTFLKLKGWCWNFFNITFKPGSHLWDKHKHKHRKIQVWTCMKKAQEQAQEKDTFSFLLCLCLFRLFHQCDHSLNKHKQRTQHTVHFARAYFSFSCAYFTCVNIVLEIFMFEYLIRWRHKLYFLTLLITKVLFCC